MMFILEDELILIEKLTNNIITCMRFIKSRPLNKIKTQISKIKTKEQGKK